MCMCDCGCGAVVIMSEHGVVHACVMCVSVVVAHECVIMYKCDVVCAVVSVFVMHI